MSDSSSGKHAAPASGSHGAPLCRSGAGAAATSRPGGPRLCHFGTFSSSEAYARNRDVAAHLRSAGWQVLECRSDATDLGSRLRAFGGFGGVASAALRLARQWVELIRKHRRSGPYDVLLVGHPAHGDVLLAAALGALRGKPVVMDAFYGLYDTVVADRRLVKPGHLLAGLVRGWEWLALRLARRVLVDTEEQARELTRAYRLAPGRVVAVPVGVDETLWQASALPEPAPTFRVACWTTFIPLHGVETVIEAARLLAGRGEGVHFDLVGDGQTAAAVQRLLAGAPLGNVAWERGLVAMRELAARARQAHCCLGIFGSGAKAGRVIPYKVVQALAAARPVITGDTPAARRLLVHERSALLVPPGDAVALADAVARLARDRALCERLASEGRRVFEARFSRAVVAEKLQQELAAVLPGRL